MTNEQKHFYMISVFTQIKRVVFLLQCDFGFIRPHCVIERQSWKSSKGFPQAPHCHWLPGTTILPFPNKRRVMESRGTCLWAAERHGRAFFCLCCLSLHKHQSAASKVMVAEMESLSSISGLLHDPHIIYMNATQNAWKFIYLLYIHSLRIWSLEVKSNNI